ncbi:MAG: hypothetical protein JSV89_04890 [Spirochaetaceae bacterium]|nr:MAG: hypothetical protein JSV89_04890 [Spirochaetaceae bacterium]
MRKPILLLLVILPVFLLLASCDIVLQVLSLSPFPGYLAQAVASTDLHEEIVAYVGSEDAEWRGAVHVLRNVGPPSEEYVFLIIRKGFGGQRVYALDTELNLISYDSIVDQYPLSLVDANDDFTVGNVKFDHTDLTATTPYYPDISIYWEDQAFSQMASRNYVLRNMGDMIEVGEFDLTWGSLSPTQITLGSPSNMWLRGIGFDPVVIDPIVGAEPVYLIFTTSDTDGDDAFLQIVRTPASDYPALATPIFSTYPVSAPVDGVRGWRDCYYTRKGVVAETNNRGRYVLVSLEGEEIKRFWVTREDEPALDFDIDGNYYYILDEKDMRLYKAATGF